MATKGHHVGNIGKEPLSFYRNERRRAAPIDPVESAGTFSWLNLQGVSHLCPAESPFLIGACLSND